MIIYSASCFGLIQLKNGIIRKLWRGKTATKKMTLPVEHFFNPISSCRSGDNSKMWQKEIRSLPAFFRCGHLA